MANAGDEAGDLVPGNLAAFAGLAPLGNLDLQLLGHREIAGRDPEPSGGDLLDLGVRDVRTILVVPGLVLAAFTGVGAGAEPVHGDRERAVRLRTQRAERHRGYDEPLDDRFDRLDLVQWNRLAERQHAHQIADGGRRVLGDVVPVGAVRLAAARIDRLLQELHQRRLEGVRLALLAVANEPEIGQLRRRVAERLAVTAPNVGFDLGQTDAREPRRCTREKAVDELAGETEGLEDLGAAVPHGRRDAHLRGDLEESLLETLQIVPSQRARGELLVAAATAEAGGRGERHVGIDGGGAVADETGEGVDVTDLAALDDDVGQVAQSGADERVMDGAGGEQGGDRRVAFVDAPVGEDQDAGSATDGGFGLRR